MAATDPERWVDEHGDCLFRYALARVRNEAAAEDLVQETLLAALKGQGGFAGRSAERTWLVGILRHKIIDYLRRQSRETPLPDEPLPPEVAAQFGDNGHWRVGGGRGPREWGDAAAALERQEFWTVLDGCLAKLPSRPAQAFLLRELEGLASQEVCQVLNITPTNLWVLLHRARLQLRQCLEQHWFAK